MDNIKYELTESDIPHTWYNPAYDVGGIAPILDAATREPVSREALARSMPPALVEQELSQEPEFEIPEPVRQLYAQWRSTPLFRARRLEKALDTPARIYYKFEGVAPTGSFKPNTALAQAYYNKLAGKTGLVGETGAGQWGSAVALAGALFDMKTKVFMVRVSFEQKPYRRTLMETYGSVCTASPSTETESGLAVLAERPDHPGSLGVAKSEALQFAFANPEYGYTRGSGLNHVCAHQSVIGQEAVKQFELADDYPDIVVGAAGGGSNLAGLAFPFLRKKLAGGRDVRLIAVEPAACPTLTRGRIAYDHADSAGLTPLFRMHTLGHKFIPPAVHAGGLRAHNIAQVVSRAVEDGLMEAVAVRQNDCFEAGVLFARAEGIVPAPESTHAIRGAVNEALRCREEGVGKTILLGLSGHGDFDLVAYQKYLAGTLSDDALSDEALQDGLDSIPSPVLV
ncbi:TrpB-like pyridoxal phosphate-dependent enzyme [Actinokineospora globicatena]|uniref:tryptophan synthase n=1 Tax=Actinokineospora globicatena TaxID=103729 RepID=A0A9W6V661_9PSEU|nr:TrpB-like pyridoxal phosphate-dependent enzyme [Actinokineospora globicatena]MCP2303406.1 tryptophan synthase beta chain [Actinokineospora globicatena]GLW79460.1 tryptophan synthase beta chain [Actinokineospora globicatena]GLW86130.1 tryptophan synthase beta chain [Actinokineospora globicatena]GLW90077.1 tryptophan synthase beta chain [Actinokineospora globicatena]